MYIYLYILYICVYVYVCVCIHIYIHICMYIYVYIYICIYIYIHTHTHIHVIYIIYKCTYMYTHTHTHTIYTYYIYVFFIAKDELVKRTARMREKLQMELQRLQDQAAKFRTLSEAAKEQASKLSRAAIAEARLLSHSQQQREQLAGLYSRPLFLLCILTGLFWHAIPPSAAAPATHRHTFVPLRKKKSTLYSGQ